MTKIKDKEKILNAVREEKHVSYKATLIKLSEHCSAEGSGNIYLKWWKGKSITQNTLQDKAFIQIWRKGQKFYRQGKIQRAPAPWNNLYRQHLKDFYKHKRKGHNRDINIRNWKISLERKT